MVYDGGNVGIGTDSPTVKLDVNGTVKATRLVGDGSGLTGGLPDENWIVSEPNIMYRESGNVGIGTDSPTAKLEVSGGIINDFAIYRNEQPSGTDGGAFTPGSWTTRTLNTTLDEYETSISRSGSQITLTAGTYYVEARAPAYHVNRHKAMLYNITDAQNALIGSSAYSDYESDDAQTDSVIRGTITISGTKTFEIRHLAQMSGTGGLASNFSVVEVFTEIYIRKLR